MSSLETFFDSSFDCSFAVLCKMNPSTEIKYEESLPLLGPDKSQSPCFLQEGKVSQYLCLVISPPRYYDILP